MKTLPMDYFGEAEEQSGGVTVAMEVDDVDSSLDMFGEGPVLDLHRLADSDFFNSFQDDFDDGDINWCSVCFIYLLFFMLSSMISSCLLGKTPEN
ncbi:hypothetical protein PHJA_002661500 [Phtheirospermum japonicum]|uniref:Uncharacterized protein n=1 Tax=Phtheirospermum japonicum TaxID=374723 RepID=A0A830DAI6_9LAMI|nr:hypothetical protein PHJA_002661500 [Phtheirospermum japonicum]